MEGKPAGVSEEAADAGRKTNPPVMARSAAKKYSRNCRRVWLYFLAAFLIAAYLRFIAAEIFLLASALMIFLLRGVVAALPPAPSFMAVGWWFS